MDDTRRDETGDDDKSEDVSEDLSFEEKRHDQLTAAPDAEESDAAPRIDVTETPEGNTRIDWRDDADVRPGIDDDKS